MIDHGEDKPDWKWACNAEGPLEDRHWSYGCRGCLIRVDAAIKSGELVVADYPHLEGLEESVERGLRAS